MDLIDGEVYASPDRPGIVLMELNGEKYALTISDAKELSTALSAAIVQARRS